MCNEMSEDCKEILKSRQQTQKLYGMRRKVLSTWRGTKIILKNRLVRVTVLIYSNNIEQVDILLILKYECTDMSTIFLFNCEKMDVIYIKFDLTTNGIFNTYLETWSVLKDGDDIFTSRIREWKVRKFVR